MTLGTALKQARKAQQLNQKQAARGICAQSMLSAIENDRYVPNARLLLALCQRLGVAVSTLSLADDFEISAEQAFNDRVRMNIGGYKMTTALFTNQVLTQATPATVRELLAQPLNSPAWAAALPTVKPTATGYVLRPPVNYQYSDFMLASPPCIL
ncbi:hypothetical protein WP50_37765 [Lactiplantibacillus plantarum]|nr:hypothetical protein WP50_37765 [Lactiplantibacillus plantarum]